MKFSFIDKNVSTTMNVFIVIANIINLVYNIPQVTKTWKTKSTKDFSGWFLSLRFIGNTIWIAYAIEVDSLLMLINNIVTVVSSGIIGYIMIHNMYKEYQLKQYNILHNPDEVDDDLANYKINITSIEHNNNKNINNINNINNNKDLEEITLT
jgi:MtN3 and saliva related transmembrane protein